MTDLPETLLGLLSIYSPTGEVKAAVAWFLDRMQNSCGFNKTYTDSMGNAIGVKGSGPKQFVFLGHIDTVPGKIQVRQEGEFLYGRGAVDAKGALAGFTDAVAALEIDPGWQVLVIGAMDEEGNSNGARAIRDEFQPKIAIIGEPSQWNRITIGYKGVQSSALKLNRYLSHSSQGESACDCLMENWQTILTKVKLYNQNKPMFEQIHATVLGMESNKDAFQMQAQIAINVRLPEAVSPEIWQKEWLGKLPEVQVITSMAGIQAFKADKDSSLARAFLGAIRTCGGIPSFVNKSGTSDMNIVAPKWNCPIVAYGPGDSTLDHTPNEHIILPEYWQSVEVIKAVLRRLGVAKH